MSDRWFCDDTLLSAFELLEPSDLARLCLVSKHFYCLASSVLYRHVRLVGTVQSCESYCGIWDALVRRGEYPARYVRILEIDIRAAHGGRLHFPLTAVKFLSPALSNLHTLALGEVFSAILGVALVDVTFPCLRKLVIHQAARGTEPFIARHAGQITHMRLPLLNPQIMLRIPGCQVPSNCLHLEAMSLRLAQWACSTPCSLTYLAIFLCHMQPGGGFGINADLGRQLFTLLLQNAPNLQQVRLVHFNCVPSLCAALKSLSDISLLSVRDVQVELGYPKLEARSVINLLTPFSTLFPLMQTLRLIAMYCPDNVPQCPSFIVNLLGATATYLQTLQFGEQVYVRDEQVCDGGCVQSSNTSWRRASSHERPCKWPTILAE
ncbi:hypothetical protein BKA62DRAFT_352377 [Auriculariales sp. MPI-PUGE-AT-0066]|nr:hypothetical protein BKA62DRAFT_352377 [Auriculariales sp. MPI-PUGE-AT-0066]